MTATKQTRHAFVNQFNKEILDVHLEEEIRLRDFAIASSINGVAFGDLQGKVTYVNDAFLKMWGGVNASEVIGKSAEVFAGSEQEALEILQTVLQKGGWEGEIEGKRKDGSSIVVYLSASLVRNLQNEPVCLMCSLIDITERKRIEEALRVKDFAISSSINGVAIGDLHGNVTYANNSFLKLWGADDVSEVIGKNAVEFAESPELALTLVNTVLSKGSWVGEITGKKKDGTLVDVQLSASLVSDEKGTPLCLLCTFVDITQRKVAEKQLSMAYENLETLVKKRTEDLVKTNQLLTREVHERRLAEKSLRQKEAELKEANTTLKVLLKTIEKDKDELEQTLLTNIRSCVLPHLEELVKSQMGEKQKAHLRLLESNLKALVSPLLKKLSSTYADFTPSQIEVAELVRAGKSTKEIANLMNISDRAVEFHRNNIRSKLGLKKKKVNLRSHLLSLA